MEGDKEFYTFSTGISTKMNAIAQLEFELAKFEAGVQHSHYTMATLSTNTNNSHAFTWFQLF